MADSIFKVMKLELIPLLKKLSTELSHSGIHFQHAELVLTIDRCIRLVEVVLAADQRPPIYVEIPETLQRQVTEMHTTILEQKTKIEYLCQAQYHLTQSLFSFIKETSILIQQTQEILNDRSRQINNLTMQLAHIQAPQPQYPSKTHHYTRNRTHDYRYP